MYKMNNGQRLESNNAHCKQEKCTWLSGALVFTQKANEVRAISFIFTSVDKRFALL